MLEQPIDWTGLTDKTFSTSKGARFKVIRVTAKSMTIRPESSSRSYDLSVPNELDRCVAEYAAGRFFPSTTDLLKAGVRPERNSYLWGVLKAVLVDHVLENTAPPKSVKKTAPRKSFVGYWRITHMPNFDDSFLTEGAEPAYLELSRSKYGDISGHYGFSYSSGAIDGVLREFGGEVLCIFGFDGNDEMDAVTGAGWAKLIEPDKIKGEFLNDYGPFAATRSPSPSKIKARRGTLKDS